eukprot:TRINITY_DN996_c0_g2_i1.p1 TRINITY_DN996_c0_g2~~TRINITY_DN996_c0_g2_i1.p1  ORF type:complete len:603 (-),score=102.40 TRINITY_DN996_c0_g2_i1:143-1882(-)
MATLLGNLLQANGSDGSKSRASYVVLDSNRESRDTAVAEDFLATVPLFKCLSPELLPKLAQALTQTVFQAKEQIMIQGELGNEFYIVKDGVARVLVDGEQMCTFKSGDYFGEHAILRDGERRSATIEAVTQLTAIKITREEFQRLGLHEHLSLPKRQKVHQRHNMMAVGVSKEQARKSGALAKLQNPRISRTLSTTMTTPRLPQGQEQVTSGWWWNQYEAAKGIFTDSFNLSALLLVPLGLWCAHAEYPPGWIFVANFLAIVPLAGILGGATDAVSRSVGQLLGGLLSATFGNAVEMIMCVHAVKSGLIDVVKSNLLGSILSNLLLVLGMAIFAAGLGRKTQAFNSKGAAANMTCQLVASISIVLPTCYAAVTDAPEEDVTSISRTCSCFLVVVYGMFVYFMLKTHADLFVDEGEEEQEEEDEEVTLAAPLAAALLLLVTLLVYVSSESLVTSVEGVVEDWGLSRAFIGVILLPIVGNAGEHLTAVTAAHKGQMDLALGIAIGSSTQIALFVVPCAVFVGWAYDKPMNLNFTIFDTTCQILSVFLVSQVLGHGETNWLHGVMLMVVYVFIAVQTLYIHY